MKTFDEAIKNVIREELTATEAEADESSKRFAAEMRELLLPFQPNLEEARNHPAVDKIIVTLMTFVAQGQMSGPDALISAFMNGLLVGLDMNRMDSL